MPMWKLAPACKDYLWGGTKLRDVYGKKCDYKNIISKATVSRWRRPGCFPATRTA